MNDQSRPEPRPRVVVEEVDDDLIAIEQYINGSRRRTTCERRDLDYTVKACLADARAEIAASKRRNAERKIAEDAARHRRVYYGVAQNHGIGFADRTVGRPKGAKLGGVPDTSSRAAVVLATVDLL